MFYGSKFAPFSFFDKKIKKKGEKFRFLEYFNAMILQSSLLENQNSKNGIKKRKSKK